MSEMRGTGYDLCKISKNLAFLTAFMHDRSDPFILSMYSVLPSLAFHQLSSFSMVCCLLVTMLPLQLPSVAVKLFNWAENTASWSSFYHGGMQED